MEQIVSILKHVGFRDEPLSVNFGEKYSLTRKIYSPWEIRVRIFDNGRIVPEIEISREYLEHLTTDIRAPAVYELRNIICKHDENICAKLRIRHRPSNKFVTKTLSYYKITLRPPAMLTPWKPIVVAAIATFAIGLFVNWLLHR